MNNVAIIGRLVRDPETRTTSSGKTVASFTLAVSRFKKGEADFIPCVVWNTTAEIVGKYLHKGSQCGVVGRIQVRSYEAKDGSKRYVTEVVADSVEFLGKKDSTETAGQFGQPIPDEEIPF